MKGKLRNLYMYILSTRRTIWYNTYPIWHKSFKFSITVNKDYGWLYLKYYLSYIIYFKLLKYIFNKTLFIIDRVGLI